jgi:hypothetical protein
MKRNRSKKRFIPEGAIVSPDGSWFYKYTEEDLKDFVIPASLKEIGFGKPIGFGELICTAD